MYNGLSEKKLLCKDVPFQTSDVVGGQLAEQSAVA